MDHDAPFAGTLLMPMERPFRFRSPVLHDGEEIATIRRLVNRVRYRFAIQGADGSRWAAGTPRAIYRTRGSAPLVVLRDTTVMLRDGPILTGSWDGSEIVLSDVLGRRMARVEGTSPSDTSHLPYDIHFSAYQPVLTLLQAIGLAHLLREAHRREGAF